MSCNHTATQSRQCATCQDTPRIDFDSLTPSQRRTLGRIAIYEDTNAYHPTTIKKLLALGVIEQRTRTMGADRFGAITVTMYEMPTWAHIQWCEWCSKKSTKTLRQKRFGGRTT